MPQNLKYLAKNTQSIYERTAKSFANERSQSLFEKAWLDKFVQLLPKNGTVLDLGCGTGQPITAYIKSRKMSVVGLDASHNLLEIAKEHDPKGEWRFGDMRSFEFSERFNGIIAWHSFFHLTPDEQRQSLPNIINHLLPRGVLMLSVGANEGEVVGRVGKDEVYHSSLSQAEYVEILASQGMIVLEFVKEDQQTHGATILLAQKIDAKEDYTKELGEVE